MNSPADSSRTARRLTEVDAGALLDVVVVVVEAGTVAIGSSASYRVVVHDETTAADTGGGAAELDLLFLGQPVVQGLVHGARCVVRGRVVKRERRLVVWNPRYQLLTVPSGATTQVAARQVAKQHVVESVVAGESNIDVIGTDRSDETGVSDTDRDAGGGVDDPTVAPAGRFRVYLGPAAGVGKTFAMLDEGRRRRKRGRDVVVAVVNTHGRPATAAQLAGLEVIRPKTVNYRGALFEEMDLDAVLARHPDIALVDELAHTNVPGAGRNEKRWQDVLELLAANISVISTVNIQHVESIADVVERVSGVPVHERVPDAVLRRADQIELVDSSPEQLRRRMLHGNIYPPTRARRALNGFFRTGTLTALRELTLRFLADEVDDDLIERLTAGAAAEVCERVLVAVTPAPGADIVLRRAARLAARLKADLYAVHVRDLERTGGEPETAEVAALRILADDLGAQWSQVDGDPVTALIDFARDHQVTQIVLGRGRRRRWQRLVNGGSTVRRITTRAVAAGVDVHIVARDLPVTDVRLITPTLANPGGAAASERRPHPRGFSATR